MCDWYTPTASSPYLFSLKPCWLLYSTSGMGSWVGFLLHLACLFLRFREQLVCEAFYFFVVGLKFYVAICGSLFYQLFCASLCSC